jgi:hypothetical protein
LHPRQFRIRQSGTAAAIHRLNGSIGIAQTGRSAISTALQIALRRLQSGQPMTPRETSKLMAAPAPLAGIAGMAAARAMPARR